MGIGRALQELIELRGTNVNELSKGIDVSAQTLYSMIRRDSMKADINILFKICDYLDVDIDYFYKNRTLNFSNTFFLTDHEKELVNKYRELPEMQEAVDRILGINHNND